MFTIYLKKIASHEFSIYALRKSLESRKRLDYDMERWRGL